jgi:hypothetical protein
MSNNDSKNSQSLLVLPKIKSRTFLGMPNRLPWLGLGMPRDGFPLDLGDVIPLMPRNMSHCTLTIELELHLHSIAITISCSYL